MFFAVDALVLLATSASAEGCKGSKVPKAELRSTKPEPSSAN
jgi:hypothetical protein